MSYYGAGAIRHFTVPLYYSNWDEVVESMLRHEPELLKDLMLHVLTRKYHGLEPFLEPMVALPDPDDEMSHVTVVNGTHRAVVVLLTGEPIQVVNEYPTPGPQYEVEVDFGPGALGAGADEWFDHIVDKFRSFPIGTSWADADTVSGRPSNTVAFLYSWDGNPNDLVAGLSERAWSLDIRPFSVRSVHLFDLEDSDA